MAKLKIYGPPRSRVARVLWAARELGLEFDRLDVSPEEKNGSFRQINPNGRFPAIQDGDLTLFESLAINLYLAKTYGLGSLYPTDPADEARAVQWSFWATNELDPWVISLLMERVFKPEPARDAAAGDLAEAKVRIPVAVLDKALEGRAYILGGAFTIADLNIAAVLGVVAMAGWSLEAWPNVWAWLERCHARPACQG